MTEESDFNKYHPTITLVTINEAAKSFGLGNEILSLNGKRVALNSFILLLATDDKTHGPFLMNAKCARELYARLVDEGFGPQKT